jgi:hypothetical protein
MGLFWMLPLAGINLVLIHRDSLVRNAVRIATSLTDALIPIGLFMYNNYMVSGFLSGMDRSRFRMRMKETPWESFWINLQDMPLVVAMDFTTLGFYRPRYRQDDAFPEYILATIIVAAILIALFYARKTLLIPATKSTVVVDLKSKVTEFLVAQYVVVFWFATLMLWTFGNNDRMSTRFMLPVYVFLISLVFIGYQKIPENNQLLKRSLAAILLVTFCVQVSKVYFQ